MKLSPRQAIAQNCKECIYDSEAGGTWREQVEACKIITCNLHEHRPLTAKTRAFEKEKVLAMLTPAQREVALERNRISAENMRNIKNKGDL